LSPEQTAIWRSRLLSAPSLFIASAIVTWPLIVEKNAFDAFYEFSRAYDTWGGDEVALLTLNLAVALGLSDYLKSRKLRRLREYRALERNRAKVNARHDPLTGLINRRAFYEVMDQIFSDPEGPDATRYVALIDLDRFKPVNDQHGHAAGDAALCASAERMREEAGAGGAVARLGGDEFVLVFGPAMDAASVERTARRILRSVAKPIPFEGRQLSVGASLGLVQWDAARGLTEMMRRADHALFQAKSNGRGQFAWYDADADRQTRDRAEIAADLKEAVAHQEIVPYFQPIVKIGNTELVGFEVLARWHHPTRGDIPPTIFIEIAEDSGLIGELGMSILRKACAQALDWPEILGMSFNVSPIQFVEQELVAQIKQVLDETGFDPRRLTIEITESSVIDDFSAAAQKIEALKALGIKIALDDFGTGYSSLACLRSLPFDRLKIDRSFVTDVSEQEQSQKIVNGILSLASGLNLEVTAEGIETIEDLTYLQKQSCSLGQGFFFEKPVPAEQISWLLETEWSDRVICRPPLKVAG